jgi:predicted MFS family arabinose efflux permease
MINAARPSTRPARGGIVRSLADVVASGARDRSYRKHVLLLLGLALAVDYADRAAVGALGPDLERAFGVSNTQLGLLASAFSVVGGLATIPAGILADRMRRTVLVATAVGLWSLAMGATGAATTFGFLVGARVVLGVVTAAARPAMFSMTGDVFESEVRGRALGVVNSGALVGDGTGFLLAGTVAAAFSWRGAFWLLGTVGLGLVYLLWRLPEPPRRAQDAPAAGVARSFTAATRYVLSVPTQVLVMMATASSSFFFAGLRTFVIVFAVRSYGVDGSIADVALVVAGLGGIAGILAGGRIGDQLMASGRLNARLVVSSYSYLVAALVLVPAFLLPSLWLALPLYVVGAASLAAPIASLDAVRLDVIRPQLWGRAEGIRTMTLIVAEAGAPLLFGFLADRIAGGGLTGLRWTFLGSLSTLLASALILQLARRFYPGDLAAASRCANPQTIEG